MDKSKERAPEDWEGAFDMDQKPIPPDFDMDYEQGAPASDGGGEEKE